MCVKMRYISVVLFFCSVILINVLPGISLFAEETPAAPPATGVTGAAVPAQGGIWGTGEGTGTATTPTAGQGGATQNQPVDPDKVVVSIAFSKAEISNVLTFLSMASGVPIVVDGEAKGTVTIISVKKVSLSTAYEVINSALRVRGYAMVGTLNDKLIRVVPLKKAIADRAEVYTGTDITKVGMSDNVVTQVIPLANVSATKIREELRPLIAEDQASLVAISGSNTLVVTDTEGNIRRLLQIINLLDVDTNDVLEVEVYSCKYASATALATSLEKIFNAQKPTVPGQPQQGGRPPEANPATAAAASGTGVFDLKGEMHLAADDRTNSIVIFASRPKINTVLKLVEKLDIDTTPEVRAKVFTLKFADAQLVATQLNSLFEQPSGGSTNSPFGRMGGGQTRATPGANDYAGLKQNTVVADVRTNSVIVTATEQNMKQFEDMVKELDAPTVLSDITRTFQLKYATAPTIAQTLTQLFRGSSQSRFSFADLFSGNSSRAGDPVASLRNITVVADQKSNTLLITGPPQTFSMVENIINQLDQRTVQVYIEVAIVDVTLTDDTKFGIEWNWNSESTVPGTTTPEKSIGTDFGLATEKLGLRYSVISDNLKVLLHALESRSNVKVYSTPSITTADNVQARISIGQDIPFVSAEEVSNNGNLRRTVSFKNVSIALTVTPHVNISSDLIALDVLQTINELIGQEVELNAPITANREAKTSVMVKDGQTIVIGGIIKENRERVTTGVPILSKIPLLGEAFKSRSWKSQKSELMVFLTPRILRDDEGVDRVKGEQLNKLSDHPTELLPQTTTVPAAPVTAPPAQ